MNATVHLRGHRALRLGRCSLGRHVYHVSTSTHLRLRLFSDFYTARVVARCLNDPLALGANALLAWVVMPDHIHVLLQLAEVGSLSQVVNRLKGSSARAVNLRLGRVGPVWQRAFHDHMLRREEDLETVGRYIVANPLRAGLVSRIADYPHWDAFWVAPEGAPTTEAGRA